MNPRLYSLTLTRIPRYSTGWVTKKLINLLRLAAVQERAIADSTSSNIRRAPTMVKGLRHIRLEFDPDPIDDISGLEDEDLDAGDFVTMADEEFSFFGDTGWRSLSTSNSPRSDDFSSADAKRQGPNADENPEELDCPPFSETQGDYVEHTGSWNGQDFTIPVWIGSGVFNNHLAVNEYMKNLCNPELQSDIIPTSPNHVAAGVPPGSYIYQKAWDAMLAPPRWGRPLRSDLTKMKDVVAELKKYRLDTRAAYKRAKDAAGGITVPLGEPHFFWSGKLEVALNDHAVHSSKYWR
ncbi:putative leucine rich repeat domain containing protein [Phaeoacremonium minimum UCRPA7]|uniref:Putative leucine rich repeat domain containing protein n=1 Tax=Phaeoacremonium minimum (strain UCR-PA7) TaxID=1286976 RepID=R8BAG9_PHAM7|nr:putative leucine rich repeat domain containing protein [Phaeoacremonium minimum UCRPA7]EON96282.1 putative leucine rich repeat domain containing protein [Phaeoacremonium minimum UCRPA7]